MAKGAKSKPGIVPLGDKVLVAVPPREEKTAAGIIIPDTVNDNQSGLKQGKVVAVGEGKYEHGELVPMHVKVGDDVLFQWGDEVEIDGSEYFVVSENNIAGVFVKK